MKASETGLLNLLQQAFQFSIPIYQRTYSWREQECRQLWNDILRAGSAGVAGHFLGSIVYVESGIPLVAKRVPHLVIDGQQRLTSVTLLLAALADSLDLLPEAEQEPIEGFSPIKIRHYFLGNPLESGSRRDKLVLTQTDRETLNAIIRQHPLPVERSIRVEENYAYFRQQIALLGDDLAPLCQGLAKLLVVEIALSRDHDNPQLIFESMNSTGRELTQADLIRNYVLMGLEPELQSRLYERHWRQMELEFGQEAYGEYFDDFVRHYLTLKTGEIPNINAVYDAFKAFTRRTDVAAAGIDTLVADLRKYASYFCAMALGREQDPELTRAFQDLRELRVEVAYPLLLELYADWKLGLLSRTDFTAALRLIESYVFRRAICAIPTNSLNRTFANFARTLDKSHYVASIGRHLLELPSYRRFPRDEEFLREMAARDLYNMRNRSYWLRRLENHGTKEPAPVENYTIEHIMPQNERLSAAWREMLGPDWERVHREKVHTLGNLTLTGYNSEYSDRAFLEKRDMPGGFRQSPLRLNRSLGDVTHWDEAAIAARGHELALQACDVWPAPPASSAPQPSTYRRQSYEILDFPQLASGPVRDLFNALQREVLALDACVTEEFLKHYIAYKAESTIVNVVPQKRQLLLNINIPFANLHDPMGKARDVSEIGRWGNGEAQVFLATVTDVPYVIGLVRQALEQQLGPVSAT
ncbi:MAG: DUF262 and DUF1524 domain-containing protein [Chloroflexota bacterium]|nr:DUF262 and DUF1524 domain-containing protein [Chloroflexota bacterium]